MAISNLAAIAAALSTNFAPDLSRLWNREAIFLSNVPKKAGSHKSVFWSVSDSGATANVVSEGADVDPSEYNIDDKLALSLDRIIVRSAFGLTHTEIAVAMRSAGSAAAIMDLVGESMLGCATKVASKLNSDAINSTSGMIGLFASLQALTYGGKTRASYTGLQPTTVAVSGSLSMGHLGKAAAGIMTKTNTVPQFILGNAATTLQFDTLVEATRHVVNSDSQLKEYRAGTAAQLPNVPRLFWRDIPIFQDKDMPDGYLIMGSWDALELDVLPYQGAGDAVSQVSKPLLRGAGDQFSSLDVPVSVYPVAKTGSSVKFAMECEAQLKNKAPNKFAILTNITIP